MTDDRSGVHSPKSISVDENLFSLVFIYHFPVRVALFSMCPFEFKFAALPNNGNKLIIKLIAVLFYYYKYGIIIIIYNYI